MNTSSTSLLTFDHGLGPPMSEPIQQLLKETNILQKKHQRHGAEYRVRQIPIHLDNQTILSSINTSTIPIINTNQNNLSKNNRPMSAVSNFTSNQNKKKNDILRPQSTIVLKNSFDRFNNLSDSLSNSIDSKTVDTTIIKSSHEFEEYDPKIEAEKDVKRLVAEVTALREKASELTYTLTVLARKTEECEFEAYNLKYEIGIEQERAVGMEEIQKKKKEVENLEQATNEAIAYGETLEFILLRCENEKLEATNICNAYEKALNVHNRELILKKGLLLQVKKAKEAEFSMFFKSQGDVKRQLLDSIHR